MPQRWEEYNLCTQRFNSTLLNVYYECSWLSGKTNACKPKDQCMVRTLLDLTSYNFETNYKIIYQQK